MRRGRDDSVFAKRMTYADEAMSGVTASFGRARMEGE